MVRRLFLSRFARLAALPFALGSSSLGGQTPHKTLKIMMKSAWGFRRSDQGGLPLPAWVGACGSGTRGAVFPAGGGGWTDAKDACQRGYASRMATCG
jgi:hypothetical protein